MREAQAMARLSHPNIVGVHEVGEDGDSVYVAMEFVRGRSLDVWLEERHPWREVVDVFVQAGRGLQAAHEAGLIHRDFKPANAIFGEDGRVKVLDFGLARAGEVAALAEPGAAGEGRSMLDVRLTRTGSMMGTPAYMSPEQHLGRDITAASDQFSFFVALYEALYGGLPFPGEGLVELVAAALERPPAEPPSGADAPAWLRAVVWRGLEKDPARRFPDMAAALAALSRDPQRRRVRLAAIAGLMLTSAGASAAIVSAGEPEVGRCEDVTARVEQVWQPERLAAAKAAFTGAGDRFGAATWTLVEPRLAAWVDGWTRVRADRCRALADGQLSEALHDRSVACLERQVARLDGMLKVFVAADAAAIEQAPIAVAGLPPPTACADADYLLSEVPLPEDPAARAAAARGREALEQARASIDLGRYDAALARADEVATEARAVKYDPLLALAEVVRGDALQWKQDGPGADAALTSALELGLASGDDRVAAEALARRLFVRAALAGEPTRALADLGVGRALTRRVHADARLSWLLANNAAIAHERAMQFDEAGTSYEEALRAVESLPDSAEAVIAKHNLGLLYAARTRYDKARPMLADATVAAARVFGDGHPLLVAFLEAESVAAVFSGRLREAETLSQRALEVAASLPSPNPALVLPILETQAQIAFDRHDPAGEQLAERAHALAVASFGAEHPRTAYSSIHTLTYRPELEQQRAEILRDLAGTNVKMWSDALLDHLRVLQRARQHERMLAVLAESRGLAAWAELSPDVRLELGQLEADALITLGRTADARRLLDGLGAAGSAWVQARLDVQRGRLALATGEPAVAVALLRSVVATYAEVTDPDHPEYLEVQLELARALRAAGATQEAAALAVRLRDVYATLGPAFTAERAELDVWRP
jgi:tetratricopeptide (TPR) repeat protein